MAYELQPQLWVLDSCEYFTLPAVLQGKWCPPSENEQVLDVALARLPTNRSNMEETFAFPLCLVCIFPCLIH